MGLLTDLLKNIEARLASQLRLYNHIFSSSAGKHVFIH